MPDLYTRPIVEVTPAVPNRVEVVFENSLPIIEIIAEAPPVIEISAIGLQGIPGKDADSLETHDFSVGGSLVVKQGLNRIYFDQPAHIESIWASVGTPPAGGAIVLDINRNGTSIFATSADRPIITAGSYLANVAVPATTNLGIGDYLTVDVDAVGATLPGAALTVTVRTKKI